MLSSSSSSQVDEAPEDNYDNGGNLQTTGYNLNGAFKIDIIRSTRTAELHPTQALLDICNWRAVAPRGVAANAFPSTCILRRDINQRVLSSDAFEVRVCFLAVRDRKKTSAVAL